MLWKKFNCVGTLKVIYRNVLCKCLVLNFLRQKMNPKFLHNILWSTNTTMLVINANHSFFVTNVLWFSNSYNPKHYSYKSKLCDVIPVVHDLKIIRERYFFGFCKACDRVVALYFSHCCFFVHFLKQLITLHFVLFSIVFSFPTAFWFYLFFCFGPSLSFMLKLTCNEAVDSVMKISGKKSEPDSIHF